MPTHNTKGPRASILWMPSFLDGAPAHVVEKCHWQCQDQKRCPRSARVFRVVRPGGDAVQAVAAADRIIRYDVQSGLVAGRAFASNAQGIRQANRSRRLAVAP